MPGEIREMEGQEYASQLLLTEINQDTTSNLTYLTLKVTNEGDKVVKQMKIAALLISSEGLPIEEIQSIWIDDLKPGNETEVEIMIKNAVEYKSIRYTVKEILIE